MKTLAKILVVLIVVAGVGFFALPMLGADNPLGRLATSAQTAAANAALDATGAKDQVQNLLESNADRIANALGVSPAEVNKAIDNLNVAGWEATSLPAGAVENGTSDVSYNGVDAAITTYDDPSLVTVEAYGQNITFNVPESAQGYLGYLAYL